MAKAPAKAAPAHGEAAPAGKSKKKLIIIIAAAVLVLAGVGGGAAFFLSKKHSGSKEKEEKVEAPKVSAFLPMEPFTVNLQSDAGDKYLQVTMTLEVEGEEQANLIKANMPQVRSRLLLLLSSKDASEIITADGKKNWYKKLNEKVSQPFAPKGESQKVSGVYFTSFVVQ